MNEGEKGAKKWKGTKEGKVGRLPTVRNGWNMILGARFQRPTSATFMPSPSSSEQAQSVPPDPDMMDEIKFREFGSVLTERTL